MQQPGLMPKVSVEAWAVPDDGVDLLTLIEQLVNELHYDIIEVDRAGGRVKVLMEDATWPG